MPCRTWLQRKLAWLQQIYCVVERGPVPDWTKFSEEVEELLRRDVVARARLATMSHPLRWEHDVGIPQILDEQSSIHHHQWLAKFSTNAAMAGAGGP